MTCVGVMEALLEEGCIIVATSNRAPWDLNRHGLHEDLFGHFVQNLLEACQPYQLSAEQDYRRLLVFIFAHIISAHDQLLQQCLPFREQLPVFLTWNIFLLYVCL